MSQELEQFVEDLKRAAEENRALFLGSIQMLAGAVDEKDPYTRGHSDRVTRYSLLIGKEMKLAGPYSWKRCKFPRSSTTWGRSASKTAFSRNPAR